MGFAELFTVGLPFLAGWLQTLVPDSVHYLLVAVWGLASVPPCLNVCCQLLMFKQAGACALQCHHYHVA